MSLISVDARTASRNKGRLHMPTESLDLAVVLRRLPILTPEQQDELARAAPSRAATPAAQVKELVDRGWLTPYQAERILAGHADALVLGAYVILDLLGAGGMGQVFKARHQTMGRAVALKVIRGERLDNADAVRRFERE